MRERQWPPTDMSMNCLFRNRKGTVKQMKYQKIIHAFPSLDMRKLSAGRTHGDPLLTGSGASFYASGRAALFHIVKSLNLPEESVILLPSYNCGVEVEAVLRAGCKVDFFRVKNNLLIDTDHLAGKISARTKAIVAAHYFGFPQDVAVLKELCAGRDLVLIEDCAHALYSRYGNGRWLGTEGDFGLFSMRKTVSMPNGGAALVNRKDLAPPGKGMKKTAPGLLKGIARSILENEAARSGITSRISWRLLALHEQRAATACGTTPNATEDPRWYYDVPMFDYQNDIALFSLFCVGRERFDDVIAARIRNYAALEQILKERLPCDFVFQNLPEGVCPLCLPLFVAERDTVADRMSGHGVVPFVFGRHPHPLVSAGEFPEITSLSDTIIGLPVHQQLALDDMELVADAFITSSGR